MEPLAPFGEPVELLEGKTVSFANGLEIRLDNFYHKDSPLGHVVCGCIVTLKKGGATHCFRKNFLADGPVNPAKRSKELWECYTVEPCAYYFDKSITVVVHDQRLPADSKLH